MEDKALREHIKKLTTPIFNKFLQEANLGSMALKRILFRPNNYRRKALVFLNDLKKESTLQNINSALYKGDKEIKSCHFSKSNKLIFVELNSHIRLQIGKNCIVGIYNQLENNKKVVFKITGDSLEECGENVLKKANEIKEQIDQAIKKFCSRFEIRYDSNFTWERFEDWIKGEEFIDSLPKDMIIHDTYFKKVYDEGIEFKGGAGSPAGILVKDYLKNRAVDIPKIEEKLNSFEKKFNMIMELQERQAKANEFLAQNVNTHIPMIQKLGDSAENLSNEVTRLRSILENWFIEL